MAKRCSDAAPPARTYSRRWNTARRSCARAASSVVARSFDAGRCGSGTAVASWRECMCAACAAPVDVARAIDSDQRRLTGAAYATGHSAGLHIRLPCAPHRIAPHRTVPHRAVPCRAVPRCAALRGAAGGSAPAAGRRAMRSCVRTLGAVRGEALNPGRAAEPPRTRQTNDGRTTGKRQASGTRTADNPARTGRPSPRIARRTDAATQTRRTRWQRSTSINSRFWELCCAHAGRRSRRTCAQASGSAPTSRTRTSRPRARRRRRSECGSVRRCRPCAARHEACRAARRRCGVAADRAARLRLLRGLWAADRIRAPARAADRAALCPVPARARAAVRDAAEAVAVSRAGRSRATRAAVAARAASAPPATRAPCAPCAAPAARFAATGGADA